MRQSTRNTLFTALVALAFASGYFFRRVSKKEIEEPVSYTLDGAGAAEQSQEINLSFTFTLWRRIRASFLLLLQRKRTVIVAAVLPLLGVFLMLVLGTGRGINLQDGLIIFLCISSTPIALIAVSAAVHFGNKHRGEPCSYSFNDSGIHASTDSYELTHRWSAISHVRQFGGFLLFFFSPSSAHCIPVEAAESTGALTSLIAMAASHGVSTDDA